MRQMRTEFRPMRRLSRVIGAFLLALMPPAFSANAAPPLEVYGRLPAIEMAAISHAGDKVAVVGMLAGKRRLFLVSPGQQPVSLMDVTGVKVRDINWAGDDKILLTATATVDLAFEYSASMTELASMVVIPIDGSKSWAIFGNTNRMAGTVSGYFGSVQRDGRWYGYFGGMALNPVTGQTERDGRELYEVDFETQGFKLVAHSAPGDNIWRQWEIGPDGSVAGYRDLKTGGDWWIRNAEGKEIASGNSPTGDISLISLGRSPGTILYYNARDDGIQRVFELPLAGGSPVELFENEGVNRYDIDRRTKLLIGYRRGGDVPEDHYFDPQRQKMMTAARKVFPGVTVRLVDSNDEFDRLIVETSGPGHPENWWLIDLKAKSAQTIGAAYPIEGSDVGPMRMVPYKAADGLAMAGVLTLPPGREPRNLPAIMLPHGGPTARDYPTFDWWAQAYASRGYAVFQPNFRGSTSGSDAFRMAGYGEWGRKMQSDISDGLAELVRQGIVDPKRVCIIGGSYGGYAALAGVTLQKGFYRCSVSYAGIGDVSRLISTDLRESGNDQMLIRVFRKELGSGRDLQQVSPIKFVDRTDAPVLLIHGADDTVVPLAQSSAMAGALKRAGKPVEFIKLTGEDHWLSTSETRLQMLKASVEFVEKHNPPDPAPAAK